MHGHKKRQTMNLPEVAEVLGIGRNQAYEAARRGEIPVLEFGKRKVVPSAWVQEILAGKQTG